MILNNIGGVSVHLNGLLCYNPVHQSPGDGDGDGGGDGDDAWCVVGVMGCGGVSK
jgi:hypothetical protein